MKRLFGYISDSRGVAIRTATLNKLIRDGVDVTQLSRPAGKDPATYRFEMQQIFSLNNLVYCVITIAGFILVERLFVDALGVSRWLGYGIYVTLLLTVNALYDFSWNRHSAIGLCELLIYNSRCPKCVFNLARLPAEQDGCTVCPECGAAWKLPQQNESGPPA
jgi:ssDNA-binding Zn-finger/Zn-ribbon topoisomerase 1